MSATSPSPAAETTAAPRTATTTAGPGYVLVGSYATVQILSPTEIINVIYCTIKTKPSGVTASIPVQEDEFNKGTAGSQLSNFASAIEQIVTYQHVIGAVGAQSIDQSGLYADQVVFTVQYIDPVRAPYGATATVSIGVGQLDFSDALIGRTLLADAQATIDGVYANLQAAAGG